jgi:hypothetical protein
MELKKFIAMLTSLGGAMAEVVSRLALATEARVYAWVSPCGICGGQCSTGAGLSLISSGSPVIHHCSIVVLPSGDEQ